jgi:hypothetical protein
MADQVAEVARTQLCMNNAPTLNIVSTALFFGKSSAEVSGKFTRRA